MVDVVVAALRRVPRHQRETLVGLVLLEAGNVAECDHPPMVGVCLLLAANVASERNVPDHDRLRPLEFGAAAIHYSKISQKTQEKRGNVLGRFKRKSMVPKK